MSRVFISYVHQDREKVEKLCEVLSQNGVNHWLDRNELLPGVRWKQAITQAIRSGTFFLSIHSEQRAARDRSYVNQELTVAIEEIMLRPATKPWLIPVRLDDSEVESRSIGGGETLLDLQVCDLRNWESGTRRLLSTLGIKRPRIFDGDINTRKKGNFVAPQGTPHAALRALKALGIEFSGETVARSLLYEKFEENTVRDLVGLGFLEPDRKTGTVKALIPNGDLTLALTVAALQTKPFQVAIEVLKSDINASPKVIGGQVARAMKREWSDSSKQRNGQALKKWVFVLYPNLEFPEFGGAGYLTLLTAQQEWRKKGRPRYITEETIDIIANMKSQGVSIKNMAERLRISPETIHRWKRENPSRWKDLASPKKKV